MPITDAPLALHSLRRLAIAGGGTAGHVYPAIALAEACRRVVPPVEVLFVGTTSGSEARIVPAHGLRLATVQAAPFFGVGLTSRVRAATGLIAGAREARGILRAADVQVVLGLGNFASAGTVLGAWSLGLPTVLHEANATVGLANRMLARVADRVLLGFAAAGADLPRADTTVTGTPVRVALHGALGERPARWSPASGRSFRVLVTGGSQGSGFLNGRVPELLAEVARLGVPLEVRHLTGVADEASVRAMYTGLGPVAEVHAYLDDVAPAYGWADFAITCAGAGTLAELTAVGLPALLVPLASAARDHQTANARAFAAETGTWWTPDTAWNPTTLAKRLAALATDAAGLAAAHAQLLHAATANAAAMILRACDDLLRTRRPLVTNPPASGSATR